MRVALILLVAICVPAQVRAEAGDELSVYLMTIGQGDAVFEKFGHNTIRIVDRSTGDDVVFNWGLFDFAEHRFFVNFALGRLNYWMEGFGYRDIAAFYRDCDRTIVEQELNLPAEQKRKLRDFCYWNARDENKQYAYNYYNDNCSTRVRDALDKAVDGQIKAQLENQPSGTTYRWHTRRLSRYNVGWYTLLNTVLGPAVDRPISKWEEGFLPLELAKHLKTVTIKDASGSDVPLIKGEQTVYQCTRAPEPRTPPNWTGYYFIAGMAIAGLMAWAQRSGWRRTFAIVATAYALLIGLCGWFGMWGWLCTAHWSAWRNENLFEYSPLLFPLGFLIPSLFRDRPRARSLAAALAIAAAASTVLGLILSSVLPQVIAEPMALVLPINLALAWGVWNVVRSAKPQAATEKP